MTDRNEEPSVKSLDYLKRYRRDLRWRHNALHGSAEMAKVMCQNAVRSLTTTAETKALAVQINVLLVKFRESLKDRIDP